MLVLEVGDTHAISRAAAKYFKEIGALMHFPKEIAASQI
jgi:hypothetical protein